MQGVEAQVGSLKAIQAEFLGISADVPEALAKMAEELRLSFDLLSDPQLETATFLGAKTSTRHPAAKNYPRKAFLQPSVVMFDGRGEVAFRWVMKPTFFNLFGAARRMTPEEIVKKAATS
jgi:peroxiredoxin